MSIRLHKVCTALASSMLLFMQGSIAATFTLEEATVDDITKAMDAGALSSEQLVRLYLARIAAYEDGGPTLNAIITLNPNALKEAATLDRERKMRGRRGPLHGIPVLLKDNIDTFDMPTTNGSIVLKNSVPRQDAFIAKAIRDAGGIILGKASMGEFAGGSYNTVSGQTINPYNFKRQTGGSSSGSGAAVSANLTVLAVGTDTSTSVRGPSAFTGIVGIRPTTGLISRNGIAPKNLNFDSAGPMARSVTDVALFLNVLAGGDAADPLSARVWSEETQKYSKYIAARTTKIDYTRFLKSDALKGANLGVVRDFFGGDPEIDALANAAIEKMRALGARVTEIKLDPEFVEKYLTSGGRKIRELSDYRFKADWEKYLSTLGPQAPKTVAEFIGIYENVVNKSALPVEDSVMRLLKTSLKTSADDPQYRDLIENVLPAATQAKLAIFEKYHVDALVFPYQSNFGAPIANPAYSIDDPTFVKSDRPQPSILAGYSSVGFPGVVVPMGFGVQGLPMDISFFGKPYEEGKLLGFAYAYEQATKMRKPPPLLPPLQGETIEY